jgi:hypothetical protein
MSVAPPPATALLALLLVLAGALLSGCDGGVGMFGGPGPFIRESSPDAVEIGFRGDVSNAMPLARKHCAQFERVPRYVMPTLDGGLFDCVRPGAGS